MVVEGVELNFEKGRVSNATAEKGQEFLLTMLDSDVGARYLGEFAIGTNVEINRFTRNILFDEKLGGTLPHGAGSGLSRNRQPEHQRDPLGYDLRYAPRLGDPGGWGGDLPGRAVHIKFSIDLSCRIQC